jgi:hypothetical protein
VGRFLGMTCCLVVLCTGARVSAADDGKVSIEGMATSIVVLTSSNKPNYLDARLIGSVIADLRAASPTFRDLLAVLAASPRLLILISPSNDLRYSDGLIGKTRFLVGPDRVVAFVDVVMDRANTRIRQEAVAHELGHVAEVACVGPFEDQKDLGRIIRRRSDWSGLAPKGAVLETAFATRIGQQVVQEARSTTRPTSQFIRLAAETGLTACPVLPRGDGVTFVQAETGAEGGVFEDR